MDVIANVNARPPRADALRRRRLRQGWSQRETVAALHACSTEPLPATEQLLRMWKKWEQGRHRPSARYRRLISKVLPGWDDGPSITGLLTRAAAIELTSRPPLPATIEHPFVPRDPRELFDVMNQNGDLVDRFPMPPRRRR